MVYRPGPELGSRVEFRVRELVTVVSPKRSLCLGCLNKLPEPGTDAPRPSGL